MERLIKVVPTTSRPKDEFRCNNCRAPGRQAGAMQLALGMGVSLDHSQTVPTLRPLCSSGKSQNNSRRQHIGAIQLVLAEPFLMSRYQNILSDCVLINWKCGNCVVSSLAVWSYFVLILAVG